MTAHASSPHILLVEQDNTVRQECQKLFAQAGWQCEVAPSHAWVLENELLTRHDIIVSDLTMPSKASLEFLRAMRLKKPTEAIIVTAAISNYREITDFLREGAVDVIPKPLDSRVLVESIHRICRTLAQRSFENNLYRSVTESTLVMRLRTSEVLGHKIPLPILDQLHLCGRIDKTTRLRIELAFQEALTNALEHGNLELDSIWREHFDEQGVDQYSKLKALRVLDPTFGHRTVQVSIELLENLLCIKIKDQGKGFIPKLTSEVVTHSSASELKCSGRGGAIINGAVDEVSYNAQGNEIRMKIKVAGSSENIDS